MCQQSKRVKFPLVIVFSNILVIFPRFKLTSRNLATFKSWKRLRGVKVNKLLGEGNQEDIHVCIGTYLVVIVVDQFAHPSNTIVSAAWSHDYTAPTDNEVSVFNNQCCTGTGWCKYGYINNDLTFDDWLWPSIRAYFRLTIRAYIKCQTWTSTKSRCCIWCNIKLDATLGFLVSLILLEYTIGFYTFTRWQWSRTIPRLRICILSHLHLLQCPCKQHCKWKPTS